MLGLKHQEDISNRKRKQSQNGKSMNRLRKDLRKIAHGVGNLRPGTADFGNIQQRTTHEAAK